MKRVACTVALAALSASVCGVCRAEPSFWQVAGDPAAAGEHSLLIEVERLIDEPRLGPLGDPVLPQPGRALVKLEAAGGENLRDTRLRYLYGELLTDGVVDRPERGRRVMERLIEDDPDSPLASHVWFSIAIASAKLGDRARELEAYTRALESAWTRGFRATIYMNRGESKMMAGDLPGAIDDYRQSLSVGRFAKELSLSHWGLAVALERYGDLPAALVEAHKAWNILPIALDTSGVFFVPAYETHYYRALADWARARAAKSPSEAAAIYRDAAEHWGMYAAVSDPDDRWKANAERHRATCEAEAAKQDALADEEPHAKRPR